MAGFEVRIKISALQVADALESAMTAGYAPWLGEVKSTVAPAMGWDKFFALSEFRLAVKCDSNAPDSTDDGDHSKRVTVTPKSVRAGLQAMATKYTKQFAAFVQDDGDAITAQLFWQCVIYGEEVFA